MSHRYTVNELLSASAKGRHSHEDQGVPWQNTTAGPLPACSQAIRRPSHAKLSTAVNLRVGERVAQPTEPLPRRRASRHGTSDPDTRAEQAGPAGVASPAGPMSDSRAVVSDSRVGG
ncbi:hypothetical protein [Pseudonocardia pini]|uniref:hypothetical protein n=1 Tax=Pseudonocardia pini TaxID=2758030 RepID=UPI001FE36945|nr:hypothetical protein [Pseudonocardia pini]